MGRFCSARVSGTRRDLGRVAVRGGAGGQGMGGVALEEGQSEGAPETDYGKKARNYPK